MITLLNITLGPVLDPASQWGSSTPRLKGAVEKEEFGSPLSVYMFDPPHNLHISFTMEWFADVRDIAHLHVLGLTSLALSSPGVVSRGRTLRIPEKEKAKW